MSKHTPGLWKVWSFDPGKVTDALGLVLVDAGEGCHRLKGGVDEAFANARLIAAAPDMLAALKVSNKEIKLYLSAHYGSADTIENLQYKCLEVRQMQKIIAGNETAIREAEGEDHDG